MKRSGLIVVITRSLVLTAVLASLVALAAIVSLYQLRLRDQRAEAAERMTLLLQVSLENAMLKRDIPGLKDIVERLGRQPGIAGVMILNPAGQVRFASSAALIDTAFDLPAGALCPGCAWDMKSPLERSELVADAAGASGAVLRSVKTVANREDCRQCHGDPAASPVNGILVVDHDAADLRRNALLGALALAGSGLLVVLGLVAGLYRILSRHVLAPVARLTEASEALAAGRLDRRVPAEGGDELAALGRAFNDMARRLQHSHEELAARERFVQALLDALPDGVRVIDKDFRIVLANQAYRLQHGHAGADEVGRHCYVSSHNRAEPCVHTLVTCPLAVLAKPGDRIKYQARHVTEEGRDLLVEANAARVEMATPEGPRPLVIEVIRDLEADIRISHEQRLSELGQLATGVAHEIRNPLSSVAMLLADAEANLRRGTPGAAEPSLRLIGHEVDRCLSITDSLLKLGTPPGLSPQLISLNDIVADILSLLRFEAEETGVAVVTTLEPRLRVLAPDSDLRIVMINMVQNAFHAMPSGGRLTVAGRRGDGVIELSVADTGVGIAPENLGRIFLPFWSRRADGVNGTGLGLAICQSVVKALGGAIRVDSALGTGTTFTVTLPDADVLPGDAAP